MSNQVLYVLLLIAAIMDTMTLKVRNYLIVIGFFLGFAISIHVRGPSGIGISLLGIMVAFAALSFFYYFHMIGAGDVKLLSVAGIFLGPEDLIRSLFPILLAGGVISLAKVLYERNLIERLKYLAEYFTHYFKEKKLVPYYRGDVDKSGVIPLSVAILIGIFLHQEGWI